MSAPPVGIYAHVPYCAVRCTYCDFYLKAGPKHDLDPFVEALCGEIEAAADEHAAGRTADTAHFGGGTPSLVSPARLTTVISALRRSFALPAGAEIALEANPEDLDEARLEGYAAAGVNRLSIGVQSLDDRLLKVMRRPHDSAVAIAAVAAARRSAVRSVAVDLILGLPGQSPAGALDGIARVVEMGVDHVSLYLLEVHADTILGKDVAKGRRTPMDDDGAARLYEKAAGLMESRGFEHYEISNFARPGHRSRHNLKYWTDGEYLGLGPSAHSYIGGRRWANASDLPVYLAKRGRGCARIDDDPSMGKRAAEALLMGMRLAEGVDLEALRARYGAAFSAPAPALVAALAGAGLLEGGPGPLRLTRRGRLVSNEVLERLLS